MESEIYISHEEALRLRKIAHENGFPDVWCIVNEIGLHWIFERGYFLIVDEKKWFLGKIKYGI